MKVILKISDFLLRTYLFIASAAACLVMETTLLTNGTVRLTAISMLVFFSTILIYNFHRVSGLFSEHSFSLRTIIQQIKSTPSSVKIMGGVAIIGILITAYFVHLKTLLLFFPLALLTIGYSLPVLMVNGKKKRLREIFIVKITTLSFVWSFATVTLPMADSGIDVLAASSIVLFAERFLFMLAICIPFEIRDMEQEKKWGNLTLPLIIGVNRSKFLGVFTLMIFCSIVYIQFNSNVAMKDPAIHFTSPLVLSAAVAAIFILASNPNRDNYFFRIGLDGTMQLQFILVLLFHIYQ